MRRGSPSRASGAGGQPLRESTEVVPLPRPRPGLELGIHGEEVAYFSDLSPFRLPVRPGLLQLLGLLRPVRVVHAVLAARTVLW